MVWDATMGLDRQKERRMAGEQGSTVIGKDVRIRGEISGSDDVYVDGDVEGTVSFPEGKFTIGPSGRVHANVVARDVIVEGLVEGHLRASGRVELRQGAKVIGDITAARLSIEESAVVKGRVELSQGGTAQGATAGTPEPRAQQATLPSLESRVSTGIATAK
jgi:cytoskeletal protein CcmA (bactofilin family)